MLRTAEIDGPDVLLPGSEVLLAGAGRLFVIVGAIAVVVVLAVRWRRARHGDHRRPAMLIGCVVVLVLGLVLTAWYWPPRFFVPEFPALPQLLPDDSVFYARADELSVHPRSDEMIRAQGSLALGSGFRGTVIEGVVWGNPFNLVDEDTEFAEVEMIQFPGASYLGRYPMTEPAYIEGMPTYHFDQHYLAIDTERREAWELIAANRWFGRWQAGSGARWSMDSTAYPEGSTIAAGLPLLPGTITVDEVDSGSIDHVLLGASPVTARDSFVWPARGADGRSADPAAPPMGTWLRLRDDVDLDGLGPQATVIARAAQRHGIILSDTGPGFGLRGTPDARWDDADLDTLGQLTTDDFEVVDPTPIVADPRSLAVEQQSAQG